MKLLWIIGLLAIASICSVTAYVEDEDNDFADFEFEEDVKDVKNDKEQEQQQPRDQQQNNNKVTEDSFIDDDSDDDGIVENDFDNDEFENFRDDDDQEQMPTTKKGEPKLQIVNKVPLHFRKWHNYWVEMIFIGGLVVYFINYTIGKGKNVTICHNWIAAHKSFLEENFALIGDDTKKESDNQPYGFIKESDSIYTLWCSGRNLVEGMLIELKLIKRQDLLSITMGLAKKVQDQVQIRVELSQGVMDSFVMAIASKKSVAKNFKDLTDLKQYCINVTKADEKYNLPTGFSVLSEIPEATAAMIDSRVIAVLNKYNQMIDCIHISDQYSGAVLQDQDTQQQMVKPETKKMLIVTYFFSDKSDMEDLRQLMQLVIYLIEKLKRFKLSREVSLINLKFCNKFLIILFREKPKLIRIVNVSRKNF